MNKKFLSLAFAATLSAVVVQTASNVGVVNALPPSNTDNVTICHRTHSTTNPYVRITVDQKSVSNANSKHGGGAHDLWATTLYTSKPNPNVYNPAKTYPANDKKWGDIIAFKDVSNNDLTGSARNVAGLNNTGIGAEIFNGTGNYAGLCKKVNARDYYEIEKAAGIDPKEILKEMDELQTPDFNNELTACGGSSFADCDPTKLGAASIVVTPDTATTVPGATTTTVAGAAGATTTTVASSASGTVLAAGKGAIKVCTWNDANDNGKKSKSEDALEGIKVTISGPGGAKSTAETDSSGCALFTDLEPGKWTVKSVLSVDGLKKSYDSDGKLDWASALTVTEGKIAKANYAALSADPLPATGARSSNLLAEIAAAMVLVGFALTLVRRRRTI